MKRFVEEVDRGQSTLFPAYLDDWIDEDNAIRVIDVFVDELDLGKLGFVRVDPKATGRPSYHPAVLLKLYIYGYLNRVPSSRRLEREAGLETARDERTGLKIGIALRSQWNPQVMRLGPALGYCIEEIDRAAGSPDVADHRGVFRSR